MTVKVLFFGVLAEVAGTSVKVYDETGSLGFLKMRISDDFPDLIHYSYRVAVNNELTDSDLQLKDGDEVAFLPPFAGG